MFNSWDIAWDINWLDYWRDKDKNHHDWNDAAKIIVSCCVKFLVHVSHNQDNFSMIQTD